MSEELPEGWIWCDLGDVTASSMNGFGKRSQALGTPYIVLRLADIEDGHVSLASVRRINATPEQLEAYGLRPGDLLVVRVNGSADLVGRVHQFEGANESVLFCDHFIRLRLSHPVVPRFIRYFGDTPCARDYIDQYKVSSAGQNTISQTSLNQLRIPLPPLAEQKRIVAKVEGLLAQVSAARERLKRVPAILKRFRQAVLAAACSGRLTADWREEQLGSQPASGLLAEILDERRKRGAGRRKYVEPLQPSVDGAEELPETWCWATVDAISTKVVDGVHRKPQYVPEGVPFVTVRNLTAGHGISFDQLNYITRSDHEEFIKRADPEYGDVLVSKDGTLGVVRAIRTRKEFSIFVSVALIKPVLRSMTDFLEIVLAAPQVQAGMIHTGTGLQHIHLRDLRGTCLPLPPLAEQREIVRRVEALFVLTDVIEKRVAAAMLRVGKLTQAVLAKAFRGELVPTEAKLARREGREYEPAAALLERIRAERGATSSPGQRRRGLKEARPPHQASAASPRKSRTRREKQA